VSALCLYSLPPPASACFGLLRPASACFGLLGVLLPAPGESSRPLLGREAGLHLLGKCVWWQEAAAGVRATHSLRALLLFMAAYKGLSVAVLLLLARNVRTVQEGSAEVQPATAEGATAAAAAAAAVGGGSDKDSPPEQGQGQDNVPGKDALSLVRVEPFCLDEEIHIYIDA